jgi:hypothetical protein
VDFLAGPLVRIVQHMPLPFGVIRESGGTAIATFPLGPINKKKKKKKKKASASTTRW